jgi:MinD superfamily P-loop ATPase
MSLAKMRIDTPPCDSCGGCGNGTCPWGAISVDAVTNVYSIDQTKCLGWKDCAEVNGGTTFCEDYCASNALIRQ